MGRFCTARGTLSFRGVEGRPLSGRLRDPCVASHEHHGLFLHEPDRSIGSLFYHYPRGSKTGRALRLCLPTFERQRRLAGLRSFGSTQQPLLSSITKAQEMFHNFTVRWTLLGDPLFHQRITVSAVGTGSHEDKLPTTARFFVHFKATASRSTPQTRGDLRLTTCPFESEPGQLQSAPVQTLSHRRANSKSSSVGSPDGVNDHLLFDKATAQGPSLRRLCM
jgi:hypothetical protein